MSFVDRIRRIFTPKQKDEALQSASVALQSDAKRFKALQSDKIPTKEEIQSPLSSSFEVQPKQIEVEKDSLQLGIAAGYTGRSIRDIESSLNRIETQMITKDWFLNQQTVTTEILASIGTIKLILEEHTYDTRARFESIQRSLNTLVKISMQVPEPLKSTLIGEVEKIQAQLPLTPKMEEALNFIKEIKEISYSDLANRLGYKDTSGIRGLLTNMIKRTNNIQRFEKDGQGWVKYIE
jgi:hypothetical protein